MTQKDSWETHAWFSDPDGPYLGIRSYKQTYTWGSIRIIIDEWQNSHSRAELIHTKKDLVCSTRWYPTLKESTDRISNWIVTHGIDTSNDMYYTT